MFKQELSAIFPVDYGDYDQNAWMSIRNADDGHLYLTLGNVSYPNGLNHPTPSDPHIWEHLLEGGSYELADEDGTRIRLLTHDDYLSVEYSPENPAKSFSKRFFVSDLRELLGHILPG
ncbi:MAG: hypothetical protein BGO01_13055 [Armatimonadetes bacterium 55-13]|nr:hypothetical protein [Armatimonadota bacterium]ODU53069.1 MAG: hypothetical protein ABT09_02135 [bacterium SCN 57-13]OJU61838.1 MAG: hypothetical protein BGO01_13055 [Armatimonadetes bacterium 55-13]